MMSNLQETFGWVSSIITMTTFISPIIPFINVFKGKLKYENTPTLLIGTGYCYCVAWYCYGLYYENSQLKFCNMVGIIIYLFLIIIYLAYETKKYLFDAILNALILFNGTWAAYKAIGGFMTDLELLENICIGATCAFNICPLILIYKVIKEKNYKVIPEFTAIVTISGGICWIIYGIMKANNFFANCQILGIILSVAQIIISKIYKKKYPIVEQIHENPTIDFEIARTDDVSNKNENSSDDKTDEDDEETVKIKRKPAVIASKNEKGKPK